MKNLYISFNDSKTDPTYASAETCMLVEATPFEGNVEDWDGNLNPVVSKDAEVTPLFPDNEKELRAFAKMFGWEVKVKAGTMILVTPIKAGK